ncbi:MAG: HAD family hydrolase [Candidatus Woesearchaeota archaeon]|jgi:HAD superfamily hydrolase (TIGR01549 family)
MTLKAVIFDVDGVLLDSFEANLKFFQDLLKKANCKQPTREEYSKMMHMSMMSVIKYFSKSKSDEEIQRIFDMGRFREVKYPIHLLKMPKDAKKTIHELNKQYILGIVSSRVKQSIFETPAMMKLKDYFKVVVTYEDTINHKPHPDPLFLALKQLKIKPQDSVYIGDTENDLQAAKAAGMKIIIYSKDNFPHADACTSSFADIIDIVSKMD